MEFRRNGELREQKRLRYEYRKEITEQLVDDSKKFFIAFAKGLYYDHSLHSISVSSQQVDYLERKNKFPIVNLGKIVFEANVEKSEEILRDFELRRWEFVIYEGAFSQEGTNWRAKKFNIRLQPDYEDPRHLNEFKEHFSKAFPNIGGENMDYLSLYGEEPHTQQPIILEFGELPEVKYPLWYQPIRFAKKLRLRELKRDLAVQDLYKK